MTPGQVRAWLAPQLRDRMGRRVETPEGYPDIHLDADEVLVRGPEVLPSGVLHHMTYNLETLAENLAAHLDPEDGPEPSVAELRHRVPHERIGIHAILKRLSGN